MGILPFKVIIALLLGAMEEGLELSPLMRLPSEVRVMIYNLLLDDKGHKTFTIRTETFGHQKFNIQRRRTRYRVALGVPLQQSRSTTYYLQTKVVLHTNILCVNRKIYEEASRVLYGIRSFHFGANIEAAVPFLSDLLPQTRTLIRQISLTRTLYAWMSDFDFDCEWRKVCDFIIQNMQIRKLVLRVSGGRLSKGWEKVKEYSASEFKELATVGFEGIEGVKELIRFQKLERLEMIQKMDIIPNP